MVWDPFGDKSTAGILRNKFGIQDKAALDKVEYTFIHKNMRNALKVLAREREIDVRAWKHTHLVLLKEVYPWAGSIRSHQVERVYRFNEPSNIEKDANAVFARARANGYLIDHLGEVYGELAFNHPFYDGNGRSLNVVFSEMARRQGFGIAWDKFEKPAYLAHMTNAVFGCQYDGLSHFLREKVVPLDQADPENRLSYSSFPGPT